MEIKDAIEQYFTHLAAARGLNKPTIEDYREDFEIFLRD